jgi:formylglycine-generating enzyme required for sulfatase activity
MPKHRTPAELPPLPAELRKLLKSERGVGDLAYGEYPHLVEALDDGLMEARGIVDAARELLSSSIYAAFRGDQRDALMWHFALKRDASLQSPAQRKRRAAEILGYSVDQYWKERKTAWSRASRAMLTLADAIRNEARTRPAPTESPNRGEGEQLETVASRRAGSTQSGSDPAARVAIERLARTWRRALDSRGDSPAVRSTLALQIARLLSNREVSTVPDLGLVRSRLDLGDALGELGDPRYAVARASHEEELVGPLVRIPPGPAILGSDPDVDPDAFPQEVPRLTVDVPYEYFIGRYPVTVAKFRAFLDDPSGYQARRHWHHRKAPTAARLEQLQLTAASAIANHPVTGVSWHEAMSFCSWLTARVQERGITLRDGDPPTHRVVVRMPTEIEWEKAARDPAGSRHPWPDETHLPFLVDRRLARRGSVAVGMFPDEPSYFGCADLIGNVWEWCTGSYQPPRGGRAASNRPTEQGTAPDLAPVRGSGWGPDRRFMRSACRFGVQPAETQPDRGFRLELSSMRRRRIDRVFRQVGGRRARVT